MFKTSLSLLLATSALSAGAGQADTAGFASRFFDNTYLIALEQGTEQSRKVSGLGFGGFDLAGGDPIAFERWYRSSWKDSTFTFMTQVNKNWGVVWGLRTGESGPKYTISPGLTLGIITQRQLSPNFYISLQATTLIGNKLTEKPCTANYGDVGGVHVVNCRLAAAPIAPAETLKYLVHDSPNRHKLAIKLVLTF